MTARKLIFSDAAHKILTLPDTEVFSNGVQTLRRLTTLIGRLKIAVVEMGVGAQTGVTYDPARLKPREPTVRA
ncbi:hypothetical protein [Streptomyces sp. NPDC051677]|uniref:hypothetical protein n=1 Tax=Streptomyces sp. NPDC051677 TaxID=3365669 RepID=UPI0037CD19CC